MAKAQTILLSSKRPHHQQDRYQIETYINTITSKIVADHQGEPEGWIYSHQSHWNTNHDTDIATCPIDQFSLQTKEPICGDMYHQTLCKHSHFCPTKPLHQALTLSLHEALSCPNHTLGTTVRINQISHLWPLFQPHLKLLTTMMMMMKQLYKFWLWF